MRLGLGISVHTGWAEAVAAGTRKGDIHVVLRTRLQLIDPNLPRQAYHAAKGMPAAKAQALVDEVAADAHRQARRALEAVPAEIDGEVRGLGLIGEAKSIPTDVAKVLASHALMHAAEGEMYRQALVDAANALDLRVQRIPTHALDTEMDDALSRLGRALGPPWRKDHKQATLAALAALGYRRR